MDSTSLQTAEQSLSAITLANLVDEINDHHRQAETSLNTGLQHALEAGQLLMEAKKRVDHGQCLPWIKANCTFSARTARAYMLVAHRWPKLESAKWQRVANLSFRQVAAITADRPKDKIGCVRRATRYLQQALKEATTIDEIKAIREVALDAQNTAAEEVLRMERLLGQELAQIETTATLTANIERSPSVDEDFLTAIPELSPDRQLVALSPDDSYYVEVVPSPEHRGYYFMLLYRDLDTDDSDVVYDRRPVRYDRRLLAHVLQSIHHVKPTAWIEKPADGKIPWPVESDKTSRPGRFHHEGATLDHGADQEGRAAG